MSTSREVIRQEILQAIQRYFMEDTYRFEPGKTLIQVGYAVYGTEEVSAVLDALLSGWISQGGRVRTFEQAFAEYVGTRGAVAVNSGSSANLLCLATLLHLGELKPGSEVIAPAATFITAVSPILQLGLKVVFVDVEPSTYNIDPVCVEEAISPETQALVVVHSLGLPADMDRIMAVCGRQGLKVLEDCCEAHGAEYHGKRVGGFGDLATFSFFVAHNMTTGEGGMLLSNNQVYLDMARSLREFGRLQFRRPTTQGMYTYSDGILNAYDLRYVFSHLGYNFRMTDLTASFGIAQLEKLEAFNKARIENATFYIDQLRDYEEFIQLPTCEVNCRHTYYAFPIVLRKGCPFTRTEFANHLERHQIETRAFFGGNLADQPAFRGRPVRVVGNLAVSRWLRDNLVFIGCHPRIAVEERTYVVDVIRGFLKQYR